MADDVRVPDVPLRFSRFDERGEEALVDAGGAAVGVGQLSVKKVF